MKGLYIHIPFCKSLCSYCDFPKRINQKEELIHTYLTKLKEEIEFKTKNQSIDTIYIGGGTPNFCSLSELEYLFESIRKIDLKRILEFTIECNFEFITKEAAQLFKSVGINRVSIGVQTFNKEIGKRINRMSDIHLLKEKIDILHEVGITNINLDMMFGLPGQTLLDVKDDLALALSLDVTHISYYSLILESKSVLGWKIEQGLETLPDDDMVADMYDLIMDTLKKTGYHHYEISNFAKPGYESKHNLLYWNLDEYIGCGMSAASFIEGKRITNSKIIDNYLKNNDIINIVMTEDELRGEFFWLGLRKIDGIKISDYKEKFNSDPLNDFKIDELIEKKLLKEESGYLKLTKFGLDHGNYVFEYFI